MAAPQTTESAAERLERYRREYQKLQDEEKEIAVLIRQTDGEVERNAQRSEQAAQRVHDLETNLDQYARQEIGPIYETAHGAELRLYVMKAQQEQLQAKRESLERYAATLRDLLPLVEQANKPAPPVVAVSSSGAPPTRSATIHIIQAQEDERQRLSRQMHDGPAQALTNLILQAEICERLLSNDPTQAKVELANLKNAVNTTFQRVRDFIFDLRPMILDDLGLVPTLRKYIQSFQEKNHIAATLTVSGRDRRLPQAVEVSLFRVIQEFLNNVADHAKASHVQVSLDLRDDAVIKALVEDDGQGFDVESVLQDARERHTLGVAGILDRLESLGGAVRFDSAPGQGTRVRVEVPVA